MAKGRRAERRRVTGRGRRSWAVAVLASLTATIVVWRLRTTTRAEGWRWYGLVYRTAYFLGLKVWDRRRPMSDLVELVEGPSPPPPGRALDIGCGTGTDSIYVAQHGWAVIGVDMVPRALAIAHRRADEAGVSLRFVEGDVTRLSDFGVGEGYTLLVDFGCFHTIPPDRRDAYVESVSKVAAPGSTFLLSALPARPASSRWRRASQPRRSGSASMATDGTSSAPNQFSRRPQGGRRSSRQTVRTLALRAAAPFFLICCLSWARFHVKV
jgi:SAM-dependent methyltransferase